MGRVTLPLKKRTLPKGKRSRIDHDDDHGDGDGDVDVDDEISKLPDEILVSILSCLSLRDAARTSVLSRRWENLWTLISRRLDFDWSSTMEDLRWLRKERSRERSRYANWVNRVLGNHRASKLEELRICFDIDNGYFRDIDNWVEFAARKEVKKLDLGFPGRWGGVLRDPYAFLGLDGIAILAKNKGQKWNSVFFSLTDLTLSFVSVKDEVVQYFLANCPNLVSLCVKGSNVSVNLEIADPFLKLKSLKILECPNMKRVKVSAPDLVSFGYHGPLIDVPFEDVPLLSEVYFGGENTISLVDHCQQLFGYFSMLKILKLDMSFSVFNSVARNFETQFPALSNLEQLELSTMAFGNQSLLWPFLMIKAAPFLHRFSMQMLFKSYEELYARNQLTIEDQLKELKEAISFSHQCLKEVELIGFTGCKNTVEFWLWLLEIAVSLEKVTIDVCHPSLEERPWLDVQTGDLDTARDRVRELAKTTYHHAIDIVVL
ncbi:F-box domain containing protein [Parasponia andersonii]|uniref:F-box domain containing protein n=1 Tax=Parasponia andersonii TaxID=3476 RepID=A0A2P5AKQ8_PARAD|nr:F-box domain containing protein [Parasponia andersonii]